MRNKTRQDQKKSAEGERATPMNAPPSGAPPSVVHKVFTVKVLDRQENGGRILINTGAVDRQRDRVLPAGARVENYLKNPVVQWAHNYRDPFATIGRTLTLTRSPEGLVADFELRPAANEFDPQTIVLLLWNGGWIKAASIGFQPLEAKQNNVGGHDFTDWDLLEFSLVPVPANQEALRLAVKSIDDPEGVRVIKAACTACGRELPVSATLYAMSLMDPLMLRCAECQVRDGEATLQEAESLDDEAEAPVEPKAWLRRIVVETDQARHHYAAFTTRTVDVPEDATVLVMDMELGECNEQPHPDRGTTVKFKRVVFLPPLQLARGDQVHAIERRDEADETLVAHDLWEVKALGEVFDSLPQDDAPNATGGTKAAGNVATFEQLLPVDILTDKVFERALHLTKRWHRHSKPIEVKAGRVLSKKNERKIEAARDHLNEVLAEVQEQEEEEEEKGRREANANDGLVLDQHALDLMRGAAADPLPFVRVACPFECGTSIPALSWGMYRCPNCQGTFEVIPASGVFNVPFSDAVKDETLLEVSAVEPGIVIKGAIPSHTTPKADPDTAWDAGEVLRECPSERGALRKIHAWVDGDGDPDAKSSYKLPHHLNDGRVVLRGVNNAKARLPQSDIPEGDRAGVEAHLNRHQAQFEKAAALRDFARALNEAADELSGDQHLSDEDERVLVGELRTLMATVKEVIQHE